MRIVAALGGNALLERGERPDAAIQLRHIRRAAAVLAPLAADYELIICHGNGPQVGMLALESEADAQLSTPYPLDVLVAQTQGMIGYWLTQELRNTGLKKHPVALLTQTVVDPDDPAFHDPTKFIGAVYAQDEADLLASAHGWTIKPDGPYWRRVVASPEPIGIVELAAIHDLAFHDAVVVCGGGGGAAVVRDGDGRLSGVEAIVDKDLTSEFLARELNADLLLVLTDVVAVMRDFGTPQAAPIAEIDVDELRMMSFPTGSMGPKIDACARFVEHSGKRAAIGALDDAVEIVAGRAGTTITATAAQQHRVAAVQGSAAVQGGAATSDREIRETR
ncbi:carbamate kinase [Jatrophihabitans sp.]|uniref:carbamate kinase n=1 Tax=Jatrophihabitans sp. TaxID=1932789 RepID=UPI0030C727E3|nr:carbamate kinase [Jatrophihabitans sp.]